MASLLQSVAGAGARTLLEKARSERRARRAARRGAPLESGTMPAYPDSAAIAAAETVAAAPPPAPAVVAVAFQGSASQAREQRGQQQLLLLLLMQRCGKAHTTDVCALGLRCCSIDTKSP